MSMLGGWIKELILIVMISVIADMLLPTKATQKYVRAVLGIAIIAAMIQPLTPMFQRDWADQIASAASAELVSTGQTATATEESTLEQGYAQELNTEESAQAGTLIADATRAALSENLRGHVETIAVANATTPSAIQATVIIDTSDTSVVQAMQTAVATLLHVQASQVTVRSKGGE